MLRDMFEFLNVDSGFEPDMSHRGLSAEGSDAQLWPWTHPTGSI
jgi:hypothetical protein